MTGWGNAISLDRVILMRMGRGPAIRAFDIQRAAVDGGPGPP